MGESGDQAAFCFRGIDRVATVVARAIGDEGDEVPVRGAVAAWALLVQQRADRLNDLKIGALGASANVIALAYLAPQQGCLECRGMILDVEPVADVCPFAVDR